MRLTKKYFKDNNLRQQLQVLAVQKRFFAGCMKKKTKMAEQQTKERFPPR